MTANWIENRTAYRCISISPRMVCVNISIEFGREILKQLLQNISSGETHLADVPVPRLSPRGALIKTRASLISAGTERMLVEFGRAGLLQKARQQPDKVHDVLRKMQTDGVGVTLEAVRSQLDKPMPLGYCNVGIIEEVGRDVSQFRLGERVVSNGRHAEFVSVSPTVCARIPDNVRDEEAAFTIISAIALQGIRLAAPTLGECFVVTGLGLIGLLTIQLLRGHGCRVLGVDPDESRLELAREFGAETVSLAAGESPMAAATMFSRGRGVDGVIVAAATPSNDPMNQAAEMCRQRGRVIQVGVTGMNISRELVFRKELVLQVSNSTGPGKGDPEYEEKGHDYPVGFVRWTEQRNFEAVLDMMADGRLRVESLISHRYAFSNAPEAYDVLISSEPNLGILLEYSNDASDAVNERIVHLEQAEGDVRPAGNRPRVSFIGAGNYAGRILIPAFHAAGVELSTVVTGSGVGGVHYGRKYGFKQAGTDATQVLEQRGDDIVVIATRHNTHANMVSSALQSGKHVFVEKPLALQLEEIDRIEVLLEAKSDRMLMIGFNRRFAPQIERVKSLLEPVQQPKSFVMTINATTISLDHWIQDQDIGGGRIVGEACHFIDLLRFLAGCKITRWHVASAAAAPSMTGGDDCASITLQFVDGSVGVVHYLANGHRFLPKERLEVYCGGRILQLDNYRKLRGFGWTGRQRMNLWRQNKGQQRCVAAFVEAVRNGGTSPIPAHELLEVSRITIRAAAAARAGWGNGDAESASRSTDQSETKDVSVDVAD